MHLGYNKEYTNKNFVENVAIRCENCVNSTGIYMKNMNTNYNDIITQFLFDTMLHHFGISWIIKRNQQLKYDVDKHNPYCITSAHWYNTSFCKKIHGEVIENYIRNTRTDR